MSSSSLTSRLVHLERASLGYLVLAYFVVSGLLAMQWVRAVAALGDGLAAPADERTFDIGGAQ